MLVGLLHPGEMGTALASCLATRIAWVGAGRSAATRERAGTAGFTELDNLEELAGSCEMIISVCPPGAAREVAGAVGTAGFDGLYVDANAVAPNTVRSMAPLFERFVDGCVIGPPPAGEGDTRLYLSGPEAEDVAAMFSGSVVEPRVLGGQIGQASALKMAYGGWTKGTSAMLLAVAAFARSEGVDDHLIEEWRLSIPGLGSRLHESASRVGAKAWRFSGEMSEVSAAMLAAGLPDGFHIAAGEIFEALAELKGAPGPLDLDEVLGLILREHR